MEAHGMVHPDHFGEGFEVGIRVSRRRGDRFEQNGRIGMIKCSLQDREDQVGGLGIRLLVQFQDLQPFVRNFDRKRFVGFLDADGYVLAVEVFPAELENVGNPKAACVGGEDVHVPVVETLCAGLEFQFLESLQFFFGEVFLFRLFPFQLVAVEGILFERDQFLVDGFVEQLAEDLEVGMNGIGGIAELVAEVGFVFLEKADGELVEGQVFAVEEGLELGERGLGLVVGAEFLLAEEAVHVSFEVFHEACRGLAHHGFLDLFWSNVLVLGFQVECDAFCFGQFLGEVIVQTLGVRMALADPLSLLVPVLWQHPDAEGNVLRFPVLDDPDVERDFAFGVGFFCSEDEFDGGHSIR